MAVKPDKTGEAKRSRGRPKKIVTPVIDQAKIEAKRVEEEVEAKYGFGIDKTPVFKCTKCGMVTTRPEGKFYQCTGDAYDGNDHYSNLCVKCTRQYFDTFKQRYGSEKFALLLTCCLEGNYFNEKLYEGMIMNGDEFSIGTYFRSLNWPQYKGKTFTTYLLELKNEEKVFLPTGEVKEYRESKWKPGDRQNKKFVIQTLGYDCFDDDNFSDDDAKFLYNTLAAYLTEEVSEDPHKMQCVISMVKNIWQVEKITTKVNSMLTSLSPDEGAIQKLINTKNSLQTTINQTAKENAISASGSGRRQSSNNSLTGIMKAMLNDGFDDVKANVADTMLSEAYKKISETNAKSLMNELQFTSDDYAKMVAEQSEVVARQSEEITTKDEEIRLLKIELDKFGKSGKKKAQKVEDGDSE